MNVVIGRIYEAPWGRFVGHRQGVLRSLDSPTTFSVQPHPDDYIDTGEDFAPAELGPEKIFSPPSTPQPPAPADESPGLEASGHGDASQNIPALTLGGHRPGSFVIIDGTELWWRPCLRRAEEGGIPHLYFLERASWPSLYCPTCRDPHTVAEIAARIESLLAAGNHADARAMLAEGPFAKLFFQISARKVCGGAAANRDATGIGAAMGGSTAPQTTTEYRAHCCPRITLGHGLHSPTCKNFIDDGGKHGSGQSVPHETQQGAATPGQRASAAAGTVAEPHRAPTVHRSAEPPSSTLPAIPRDDPKAEAGSFERPELWRPTLRNRAEWDEWRIERAAICEYLGGMRRELADRAALKLAGAPP